MLDKVEVLKDNGEKIIYDEISMFEVSVNSNNKKYVVLTSNELDPNGLIKLLVAEIVENRLIKIVDDSEWATIKNVMRSVISNSSYDFNYINVDSKFESAGDVFRVIAVQESAKTQLVSDYASKKPEKESIKEGIKPVLENVDPSIYPTSDSNNSGGSEIIPGIIETNSNLNDVVPVENDSLEEIKIPTDNIVNDIPNSDVPVIDIPGVTMSENSQVNVSSEPNVSNLENQNLAPFDIPTVDNVVSSKTGETTETISNSFDGPSVESSLETPVMNNDIAAVKKELIDTIVKAVDTYVSKIGISSGNDSAEVERLKQELKTMEDKLNNIMSLINK